MTNLTLQKETSGRNSFTSNQASISSSEIMFVRDSSDSRKSLERKTKLQNFLYRLVLIPNEVLQHNLHLIHQLSLRMKSKCLIISQRKILCKIFLRPNHIRTKKRLLLPAKKDHLIRLNWIHWTTCRNFWKMLKESWKKQQKRIFLIQVNFNQLWKTIRIRIQTTNLLNNTTKTRLRPKQKNKIQFQMHSLWNLRKVERI